MRFFLSIAVIAALLWGAYEHERADRAEATRADAQATASALASQLDEADQAAESKAKAAALDKQTAESEARALNQKLADATAATAAAQAAASEQAEKAAGAEKQLAAKVADLEKQLAAAQKAALRDAHQSCPPPEVVPQETQPQKYAPAYQREDGKLLWRTDYEWSESKAKELGRLQLVCWGTTSCPHCDWFLDQCSSREVGLVLFRDFVPTWITVQDQKTSDEAEQFGVNAFRYPAVMLRDPATGNYHLWRPSKDNKTFLEEVAAHAAEFK